jgi:putative transposase
VSLSRDKILNDAYRHESDADIRERILLVRRVRAEGKNVTDVAKYELHRSRAWAYKWLKRYDIDDGLNGLKDRPRNGRPQEVPEENLLKIRKELSEKSSGWQAKEIMDIIYKRTGVRYHEVHVYRLLHKWGFSSKVPRKRFVSTASKEEKEQFKKELRRSLLTSKKKDSQSQF